MSDASVESIDLKVNIVTYRNKSTGLYTSKAHALNLSADGTTPDEAEQKLELLLNQYLEKMHNDERLPEMLKNAPEGQVINVFPPADTH